MPPGPLSKELGAVQVLDPLVLVLGRPVPVPPLRVQVWSLQMSAQGLRARLGQPLAGQRHPAAMQARVVRCFPVPSSDSPSRYPRMLS